MMFSLQTITSDLETVVSLYEVHNSVQAQQSDPELPFRSSAARTFLRN